MTTPAPPPQQPVQPPPQQQDDGLDNPALAIAVAALLASAAATAVPIAAAVASLRIRFALSAAAMSALSAVVSQVMERPPAVTGVIGAASAQTSRMNAARRAQYVIAAAKRVLGAAREARAKGEPVGAAVRGALATERRYYSQHQAAMWNRATAAGQVDLEAAVHGRILGWHTVIDSRTSAECKAADKRNFYADRMPDIGWPGGVHPFAGAFPGQSGQGRRCCLVAAA